MYGLIGPVCDCGFMHEITNTEMVLVGAEIEKDKILIDFFL